MKNKKIIIIVFLLAIFIISAAYSTLATNIKLNATTTITGEWNIKITNIEIEDKTETADPGTPTFTDTSATFNAKLQKPKDFITYKITIKNKGTIDAKLDKINITSDDSGAKEILYENTSPADTLEKGEMTSFLLTVKYDDTSLAIPELKSKTITGTINYIQK